MTYRSDLEALAARHASLQTELTQKTQELTDAARLLEEARARARLPVLDNIRIASPCRADWNQMTGDERVRACGTCNKQVFNLSSMTREEAEALIVERAGNLCARYYQRADGTILLADCTIGTQRRRRNALIAAGALFALAGGGAAYKLTRPDAPRREVIMGEVEMQMPAPLEPNVHVQGTTREGPPPPEPAPRPVMGKLSPPPDFHPTMGAVAIHREPIEPEPAPTVKLQSTR